MLQKIAGRVLSPSDFFNRLAPELASQLPPRLRGFQTRRGPGRLLKLHYQHSETHYEVWHHGRSGRLEVGLHFEGPPDQNRRALEFLAPRLLEIKAGLFRAELEPWDRGWCRLYETLPAPALTDLLVADASRVLAAYVVRLEPLLDEFWSEERLTSGTQPG